MQVIFAILIWLANRNPTPLQHQDETTSATGDLASISGGHHIWLPWEIRFGKLGRSYLVAEAKCRQWRMEEARPPHRTCHACEQTIFSRTKLSSFVVSPLPISHISYYSQLSCALLPMMLCLSRTWTSHEASKASPAGTPCASHINIWYNLCNTWQHDRDRWSVAAHNSGILVGGLRSLHESLIRNDITLTRYDFSSWRNVNVRRNQIWFSKLTRYCVTSNVSETQTGQAADSRRLQLQATRVVPVLGPAGSQQRDA